MERRFPSASMRKPLFGFSKMILRQRTGAIGALANDCKGLKKMNLRQRMRVLGALANGQDPKARPKGLLF